MEAGAALTKIFENGVASGAISIEDMFDTDYVEIPGSNPVQHRTRILDWADRALPPFQEAFLARDPRMAFCVMIDRNGYLPVHNKIYSHPQQPGDVAWNTANSRNRRIFNDPAGLAAGRNQRAYLIQSYARDMGNGKMVMMREIDVPIRVKGRHWGGFRTAYRLCALSGKTQARSPSEWNASRCRSVYRPRTCPYAACSPGHSTSRRGRDQTSLPTASAASASKLADVAGNISGGRRPRRRPVRAVPATCRRPPRRWSRPTASIANASQAVQSDHVRRRR